jgi:hypothetical protein
LSAFELKVRCDFITVLNVALAVLSNTSFTISPIDLAVIPTSHPTLVDQLLKLLELTAAEIQIQSE